VKSSARKNGNISKKHLVLIFIFYFSLFSFSQVNKNSKTISLDSLAFVGQYKLLLKLNCDSASYGRACKINQENKIVSVPELNFREVDTTFLKLIQKEIVIINENHLLPQTRVSGRLIIEEFLKDTNYYFFFEALSEKLSPNSKQNITISSQSGFYLEEPQMAENIRLILKSGRTIFSYEDTTVWDFIPSKDYVEYFCRKFDVSQGLQKQLHNNLYQNSSSITRSMNKRDFNQFVNFYRQFSQIKKHNHKAKFLIVCGHGHADEYNHVQLNNIVWFTLAYFIKKFLKIDPLTIDFTSLTDHCQFDKLSYERNKFYDSIHFDSHSSNPLFLFVDSIPFGKNKLSIVELRVDYAIASRPVEYIEGREKWLISDKRQKILIPKKYLNGNSKYFKAIHSTENQLHSTPADYVYIQKGYSPFLLLYPGVYKVYDQSKYLYTLEVK